MPRIQVKKTAFLIILFLTVCSIEQIYACKSDIRNGLHEELKAQQYAGFAANDIDEFKENVSSDDPQEDHYCSKLSAAQRALYLSSISLSKANVFYNIAFVNCEKGNEEKAKSSVDKTQKIYNLVNEKFNEVRENIETWCDYLEPLTLNSTMI